MKSSNKNEEIYELIDSLNNDNLKYIESILTSFSKYLVNYDMDYLYNYKFIISHIKPFIDLLKNIKKIQEQCENIKDIIDKDREIKQFIKYIENKKPKFYIILNNSIKINFIDEKTNELINIYKNELPSKNSLEYNKEVDIKVIFEVDKFKYNRSYKKVLIKEIIDYESYDLNEENIISIICVVKKIINQYKDKIIT